MNITSLCLFTSLVATSAVAQDLSSDDDVELRGIVVDRTVMLLGHDFYRYFSNIWISQADTERYNLIVSERPSARWGSLIWIEYDHKVLYRSFIHPGHVDLKKTAEQASQKVKQALLILERQQWLPDADMDTNGY